jgi:ribonuclease P protein component
VQHTLRKSEILRGYSVFSEILKNGESIQSSALQCYFKKQKRERSVSPIRAGFAVPRRDVHLAVERNRLKRLMREAFRTNKAQLYEAVDGKDIQLALVFIFRKAGLANVRQIRYADIENDLNDVMLKIIFKLRSMQ